MSRDRAKPPAAARLAAILALLTGILFTWNVVAHYFLIDDAFISFRYARNLLDGHGLVFNPGEMVEGYTNFLWVLLMAAAMGAGLPVEIVSNVIGIAAGAGLLLAVAWFGARRTGWSDPWNWVAPLALAVNRTFGAWSTGGLETMLFSLLVFGGAARFLVERERGAGRPWGSALLFAVAALTRPEGIHFGFVAGIFLLVEVIRGRARPGALVTWSAIPVILVGAHVAWRYTTYGYLLPNTFYAKVSGFWPDQAAAYLGYFLGDHLLWWALPLPLILVARRRDLTGAYLVSQLGFFLLYILYVGGGHFEFRLMTFILPFLFWTFQEGLREASLLQASRASGSRVALRTGAALCLLLVLCAAWPHRLNHRDARRGVTRLESTVRYAARRSEEGRFLRTLVEKGFLRGDELVAVTGAGALPYYSGLPVLDFFGLNDLFVAHQEIPERGRIAHEKKAPWEYLVERGVVIFDIRNRIVLPPGAVPPSRRTVERRGIYSGPVRCVEAEGRLLRFATTLNDEEFRERFARFRILY